MKNCTITRLQAGKQPLFGNNTVGAVFSSLVVMKKMKFVVAGLLFTLLSLVSIDSFAARTFAFSGGGTSTAPFPGLSVVVLTFTAVQGNTANSLEGFNFSTSGTGAVNTDVYGYSVFANSSNTLVGATFCGNVVNTQTVTTATTQTLLTITGGAPYMFVAAASSTNYFFIVATFLPTATPGHVLTVAGPVATGNYTWLNAETYSGAITAGNATITALPCLTLEYAYTGSVQPFTVPAGVTSLNVVVNGAAGAEFPGYGTGGSGGSVTATVAVAAGDVLQLYVGQKGAQGCSCSTLPAGGSNSGGGATGGNGADDDGAGAGGGSSDIRFLAGSTTTSLLTRVVTAGGGGGGSFASTGGETGGIGANASGAGGGKSRGYGGAAWTIGYDGSPGTTAAGGSAGTTGSGGTAGVMGAGGNGNNSAYGAGGGGGYYGAGGAYSGPACGGSSYAVTYSTKTVSGVIYNDGFVTGNGSILITMPTPTLQTVTGGGTGCPGVGVAVGLASSTNGVIYALYLGGVATGATVTGTGSAITFGNQATAGTYTVKAYYSGYSSCTTAMTGSAVVALYASTTITVTPTTGIKCSTGGAVALSGLAGLTSYSWSPATGLSATTGANVNASPTVTTTYSVTGVDAHGCVTIPAGGATTVITYNTPSATITGPSSTLCLPGSMALTETGIGGTWGTTDATKATVNTSGLVTGVAAGSVSITYANASCGGTVTYPMTVSNGGFTVTVNPTSGTYCTTGSSAISMTASGAITYSWSPAAGLSATTGATVTASPSVTTTYVAIGTTGGCSNSASAVITNNTPTSVSGGLTTICAGTNTTWTGVGGDTWTSNNSAIATVAAGVVTGVAAGSTTITYKIASTGCYITRGITVNASSALSFTPTSASNCGGTGVSVTASGASTYTWAPATGLSATTGATVTATPTVATTYTISGTNVSGCVTTATKLVNYGATGVTASATASPTTTCLGGTATLSATAGATSSTTLYSVTQPNYTTITQTTPIAPALTSGSTDDGYYTLTIPFTFNYFGTNYTSISVSTNGVAELGAAPSTTAYGSYTLPSASATVNGIALFNRDLNIAGATGGAFTYSTEGTAPNRTFVMKFNNVCTYGATAGGWTGEIVLYETTNVIDLVTESTVGGVYATFSAIQNAAGTIAFAGTGRNYQSGGLSLTHETWRFTPQLTATDTKTFVWAPAGGTTTGTSATSATTATVSATGAYSVTVTDVTTGCSATATTATVTIGTLSATVSAPTVACSGSTATWTFAGTAGATVYYSINGGATANVTLNGSGAGTATATISATKTLALSSISSGSCSNSISGSAAISPITCLCTPSYYSSPTSTYAMSGVAIPTGASGTSLSSTFTAGGWVNNTTLGSAITFQTGGTYTGTLTYNTYNDYYMDEIWIDYNDDGTIQSSENVTPIIGSPLSYVTSDAFTITIPCYATAGTHLMRVRNINENGSTTVSTALDPCNTTDVSSGTTVYYYYGTTVDYLVTIVKPTLSIAPTTLAFGSINMSTYGTDQDIVINASSLIPTSGNISITLPVNYYDDSLGTKYGSSSTTTVISYPYTGGSIVNGHLHVTFNPPTATTYSGNITFTGGGVCSAVTAAVSGTGLNPACNTLTLAGGAAGTSPGYGVTGSSVTLSVTGASAATGLKYQWKSSTDGITYTSMGSAATSAVYTGTMTFTSPSEVVYYQCQVTCTINSAVATSTAGTAIKETCQPSLSSYGSQTDVYTYAGYSSSLPITWTVPTGVTSITVDMTGGHGGNGDYNYSNFGGYGGQVTTTMTVVPGQVLTIDIGQAGGDAIYSTGAGGGTGGHGGGAAGGSCSAWNGGGGGGASTIYINGTLNLVAAGGGGGGGDGSGANYGGDGGYPSGGFAHASTGGADTYGGSGGSQTAGGLGGYTTSGMYTYTPSNGSYLAGGVVYYDCGTGTLYYGGGGGGGGYYGGGGGHYYSGGGGGGSNYAAAGITTSVNGTAATSGNGYVSITYLHNNTAYGISKFNMTGDGTSIADNSITPDAVTGYISKLASISPVVLDLGGQYSSSITWGTASGYQEAAVWIDYNDDGTFQQTEEVSATLGTSTPAVVGYSTTTANPTLFSINVTNNSNPGQHLMRVRGILESAPYSASTYLDPCLNSYLSSTPFYQYGDVIDYFANIKGIRADSGGVAGFDTLLFPTTINGSSSGPLNMRLDGAYLDGTSIVITPPSNYVISLDGGTTKYGTCTGCVSAAYTIASGSAPYTGSGSNYTLAATNIPVYFYPTNPIEYSEDIQIAGAGMTTQYFHVDGTSINVCSGTPNAGTASLSPVIGNYSTPIVLSLTGSTVASGLTYQWQYSTTSTTSGFTNCGSASTSSTFSFNPATFGLSASTTNTYFQCIATCTLSATSIPATYSYFYTTATPGHGTYCNPTTQSWTGTSSVSFGYSTSVQSWTVPTGETFVTIDALGAAGGAGYSNVGSASAGGNGGEVKATLNIPSGTTLSIKTGGIGGAAIISSGGSAGVNGGGHGGVYSSSSTYENGGGGGGATIVYTGTTPLVTAAGGGGGGSANATSAGGIGGSSGTNAGGSQNGTAGASSYASGGGAGTSPGGAGGVYSGYSSGGAGGATSGIAVGAGGIGGSGAGGAGGGGGYYGGGGASYLSGGGGGSSYTSAAYLSGTATYNTSSSATNGSVSITYPNNNTAYGINNLTVSTLLTESGLVALSDPYSGYLLRSSVTPIVLYSDPTTYSHYSSTLTFSTTAATAFQDAAVWIDFNNDGQFQTTEQVTYVSGTTYTGGTLAPSGSTNTVGYSATATPSPVNFDIVIPPGLAPVAGTSYLRLMRVRGVYEDVAGTRSAVALMDPCASTLGGVKYQGGNVVDYIVNIKQTAANITLTPSSLDFGTSTVSGTAGPIHTFQINADHLVDYIHITAPAGYQLIYGGTVYPAGTPLVYPTTGGYVSTVSGLNINVQFMPTGTTLASFPGVVTVYSGSGSTLVTSYVNLTGQSAAQCTGTISGGVASLAPTSGAGSTSFSLTESGATAGGGITYQWYSAPSIGGTYSAISGATNTSYTFTGIAATTYYDLQVYCPYNTTTAISNTLTATYVAPTSCHPSTTTGVDWVAESGTAVQDGIDAFGIAVPGGTSLTSATITTDGSMSTTSGYLDRTAVSAITLFAGGNYNASVTWGTGAASTVKQGQVWIDFNDDGYFSAGEAVSCTGTISTPSAPGPLGYGASLGGSNTSNFIIAIPPSANVGSHKMRIRTVKEATGGSYTNAASTYLDPCTIRYTNVSGSDLSTMSYNSGDVVDYTVVISKATITLGSSPAACVSSSTASISQTYSSTTGAPNQYNLYWGSLAATAGFTSVTGFTGTLSGTSGSIPITVPASIAAGSYTGTLTVKNSTNGDTSSAYTITVVLNATPGITAVSVSPTSVCSGSSVNLGVATTGGAGTVTYSWSGPGISTTSGTSTTIPYTGTVTPVTSTVSNVSGSYSVSVSYVGIPNCATVFTTTASVSVYGNPVVTASVTPTAICQGSNVTLSGSSSIAGTYTWTGPTGFGGSSTLSPGTVASTNSGAYTLSVVNGSCTVTATTASVTVTVPTVLTASVTPTTVCQGTNITLNGSSSAGGSYTWTGPTGFAGSSSLSPGAIASTNSGVYTLTAVNGTCTTTATTASVTVTVPTILTVSVSPTAICQGSNITLSGSSSAGGSYTWTGPTGFGGSSTLSPGAVASTNSGIYTLTAVNGSCTTTATTAAVTVTVPTTLTASVSPTAICQGSNITLNGTSSTGGSYTWTGPTGFAGSSTLSPGAVASTNSGVYTLTAVNGSCTTTATTAAVTVSIPTVLTASVSPTAICQGSNITLSGTSSTGGTYTWTGPTGFGGSSTLSPGAIASTNSGVYTLTAVNGSCINTATTASVTVTVPTVLSASVTPTSICQGSNITLSGSSSVGGTYSWSGPSGFGGSSILSPGAVASTNSGVYTLTAVVGSCTVSATTSAVTVTIPTVLTASVSPTAVCQGTNITLSGSSSAGGSYIWTGPSGFAGSTALNPGAVVSTNSGVYTLTATNGSCTTIATTAAVTVTVPTTLTASVTPTSICQGSNITLSGSSSAGGSYSWSGPSGYGGSTILSPGATVSTNSGVYTLTAVNGSCTVSATTASVAVDVMPTGLSVNASPLIMCSGANLTLTSSVIGATTYSWSGPNSYSATDGNPSAFASSLLSAGAYTLSAINGTCTVTGTSPNVAVESAPVLGSIDLSTAAVCTGATVTISETGTPTEPTSGTNSYSWYGPTGLISTGSALNSTSYASFIAGTTSFSGNYTLSATYSEAGCTATSVVSATSLAVSSTPSGTLTLSYPTYICYGIVQNLSVSMAGGSGSPSFTWSGPGITSTVSTGSIPVYSVIPSTSGSYTVAVSYAGLGCGISPIVSAPFQLSNQNWLGTADNNWNNGTNWTCGRAPWATDTVLVPYGTTYSPVLSLANGNTGNLTVFPGASVTINSGYNLNVNGNLADSGAIIGAGTLSLTGTNGQAITGKGIVNNIEVNNTTGASINSTSDSLTVTGKVILTSGNFNTSNTLILAMSDDPIAVPVNGQIAAIPTGGGSISGKVIIQQYIKGGRRAYRFWGTPFIDSIPLSQLEKTMDVTGYYGGAHGFTSTGANSASAFWYHTTNSNSSVTGGAGDPGWKPFTWATDSFSGTTHVSGDTNLVKRFEGIRLFFRGAIGEGLDATAYTPSPVTVRMWGQVNTGDLVMKLQKGTLTSTTGAPYQDYNLKSNPYPSPVDIGAVVHHAYTTGQLNGGTFWLWNPYGATAGLFVAVLDTPHYVISANTSYEVRAANISSALTFSESNKATNTGIVTLKSRPDVLALNVYDESYHVWDLLSVRFTDEATENEDKNLDAGKPVNPDLNFYSWSSDRHPLGIDSRPFEAGKVIPLGLTSNYLQNFIIKVDNYEVPSGGQVYLHDKYLEQYVLLSQGTEYPFSITKDPASQGDSRFELGLQPTVVPVSKTNGSLKVLMIPNPATSGVNVTFTAPQSEKTTVRVLSLEGVCVMTQELGVAQSGSVLLSLDNLASGVYMVEFTSGTERVVQRLVKE